MVFRSGHPRALHPLVPRRRRATMTPRRRVVHSYYPPHFRRPIFILGFGALLLLSSSSSTLPSVRLPLSYSYNPTHSIPPCYYLLDLVPLPNLSCVSSPHTQHVNASMFSPHLLFCVSTPHQSVYPALHFFPSFFLLFLMTTMAMTNTFFYYYFYDIPFFFLLLFFMLFYFILSIRCWFLLRRLFYFSPFLFSGVCLCHNFF
ncbi:hypothetical protein M413DRAFT_269065 [Hebeloma cylindrosporum]|uniref:Uncharacterized protein n=1 Tax=Hebeloma cylindrosporum TaxID=76867 RepID=A0A0C3CE67_HEBCY|nr:hypothetical protein M413DRAFT_269065 [Hebeloma cylindrosporum h7]